MADGSMSWCSRLRVSATIRMNPPRSRAEEPALPVRPALAAERLLQSGADGGKRRAPEDTTHRWQDHDLTLVPAELHFAFVRAIAA